MSLFFGLCNGIARIHFMFSLTVLIFFKLISDTIETRKFSFNTAARISTKSYTK